MPPSTTGDTVAARKGFARGGNSAVHSAHGSVPRPEHRGRRSVSVDRYTHRRNAVTDCTTFGGNPREGKQVRKAMCVCAGKGRRAHFGPQATVSNAKEVR